MHLVRVPSLAENVNEASLRAWCVEEGAAVAPGDELAELVTEKAEFTLEAEEDVRGVVLERFAAEKSTLPVGFVLCAVGADEERDALQAVRDENAQLLGQLARQPTIRIRTGDRPGHRSGGADAPVRATPAARRVAKELGVDLAAVRDALGGDGPVREEDVRRHAGDAS